MIKSKRRRWRYIFLRVHSNGALSKNEIAYGIRNALLTGFGYILFGELGYKLIDYDDKRRIGIIRVNRDFKNIVLGCIALINKINKVNVHVESIGISGTLKTGKEKFL